MPEVTFRRLPAAPAPGIHWGEAGRGEALLLLHGGHGSWAHWSANLTNLSSSYRVLAPDLPGFGDSYDPGRCLEAHEHALALVAWLDALKIDRVYAIGFSFGSLVALALATAAPQRCPALMLVNPPGVGPRSPEALALPERMSALAKAHGRRAGVEGTLRELMLARGELVTAELVDRMTAASERTRYITRAISRSAPTLTYLQSLAVPACVLLGERDPFHSHDLPGRVTAIDHVLGAGATRIIPGAAHWLQYDQPQAFGAEVRRFLAITKNSQETT